MKIVKYFMRITLLALGGLFLTIAPLSLSAQRTTSKADAPSAGRTVDVDVELELGRAKKGCSGIGVCKITVGAGLTSGTLSLVQTESQSFLQVSTLVIKSIPREAEQMHFYRDGKLVSSYHIEDELRTKLKIDGKDRNVLLPSGNYKVQKVKSGYILSQ